MRAHPPPPPPLGSYYRKIKPIEKNNWTGNKKAADLVDQRLFLATGGESGTRTPDLRIMIPSL